MPAAIVFPVGQSVYSIKATMRKMTPTERFAVLYERYLRDGCTPEELEELYRHFAERGKPSDLHGVGDIAEGSGGNVRLDEKSTERLWKRIQRVQSRRRIFRSNLFLKVAAVLLLVGTFAFLQMRKQQRSRETAYKETVHRNGTRSVRKVELPDGTVVFLKPGSRIVQTTDFGKDSARRILLEGEAFFAVAKKTGQSFAVVSADGFEIKVLGTRFNLTFGEERREVVLTEGRLSIENAEAKAWLSPGQKATYAPGRKTFETTAVDTLQYVSWIGNQIHFSDSRLEEVAAQMNRYYGPNALHIPERAKGLLFTGHLPADNLDKCIAILNRTFANYNITIN